MGIGRAAIALLRGGGAPVLGATRDLGPTDDLGNRSGGREPVCVGLSPATTKEGRLNDQKVFGVMGFASVESIDYSDFEGATHILDLNTDDIFFHPRWTVRCGTR
jgi:hypothetical protein